MRIYLVGYMGAGKSTTSKRLAKQLGWEAYDTDRLFEERFKISINEDDIKCDLDGVIDGEVPTTLDLKVMTKAELLGKVNQAAEMRNPDGSIMKDEDGNVITVGDYINAIDDGGYGFLTYRNNGTAVKEFNLFVPFTVQYGWGFITTDEPITVPVNSTIG